MKFLGEGREWRLPGLLFVDDLVLWSDLKEYRGLIIGHFVEVCKRRGL